MMTATDAPDLDSRLDDIVALFQAGLFQTALDSARKLAGQHPDSAKLHNIIGAALTKTGQIDDAMAAFRQSLALDPEYAGAHNNLGNALKELNRPADALTSYQRAASIDPAMFDAHFNSGNVTEQMGHHTAAIGHYEQALDLKPDAEPALLNLANVHGYLGNSPKAAEYYRKVLRTNPTNGNLHNNLAAHVKYRPDDLHLLQMRQLMREPAVTDSDKIGIGFALSKALDDIGEPDQSFEALSTANRAFRQQNPYDLSVDRRVAAAIKAAFEVTHPGKAGTAAHPPPAQTPIFVVGMPRSGTSLVEQILASHSAVYGAGELYALRAALDPRLLAATDPRGMSHAAPADMRDTYLDALAQLQVQEPYIVDKMPLNFRWIGFILDAMPEARILHIRRDAMATCWSNYRHYFTDGGLNYAFDQTDLGNYYRLYRDLMDYWQRALPNRFLDVNYENLTENQEPVTRQILAFCGLDWQAQCLDFAGTKRMVRSLSAVQVRQGLYQGSSEAWRKYEHHLAPLQAILDR